MCEQLSEIQPKEEDGWIDLLGTGGIKKKYIQQASIESRPTDGCHVKISAIARLEDGTIVEEFDELHFSLGEGEVIDGLDLVLKLMSKGEKSEIFMESRFAYGDFGKDEEIAPNTDLYYTVELLDFSPEKDPEELDFDTRKEIGNRKRERGNWWFNRGDYKKSIRCYKLAVDFLDDTSEPYAEKTDPRVKEIIEDRLKAYNNMAAAQIKLEAFDAALLSLNPVLRCQPDNVKALFRKAKVLKMQSKNQEALTLISKALLLEPDNKMFLAEMIQLKDKIRRQENSEKTLYRRMLGIPSPEPVIDRYPTIRGFSLKILVISFVILFTLGMILRRVMYSDTFW